MLARIDATADWSFRPSSERPGATTVLPFDAYGGLECLWGPPAGDLSYYFGYVALPAAESDTRLQALVDTQWTTTETAEGTQYCNPALEAGLVECYLVAGTNWYFSNADGVFPTLTARAPI